MLLKGLIAFVLAFPALSWANTQYVVRKGDTLLSIADQAIGNTDKNNPRRYQFVRQIRALNPNLGNLNALEPGQTITLPETAAIKPVTPTVKTTTQPTLRPTPKPVVPIQVPDDAVITETVTSAPPPVTTTTLPVIVPVESHAEAPAVAHKEEHHESTHHDFIFVQPRYQMIGLSVKDLALNTKADMKSQMSYGLDVQYGKILNDHWHLLFQAGITQTDFKDISGGNTVNHKKETTKSFSAGVAYELSSTLHLDFMLMYADRTFLLPAGVANYELKAVMIPGAELNISWDFVSGASNIFGISAIGEYVDALKKDGVE